MTLSNTIPYHIHHTHHTDQIHYLHPSQDAYHLAKIIREQSAQNIKQTHVVFLENMRACQILQQNLGFFAPEIHVEIFCDWELLPYDVFNPHAALIAQRMRLLYKLLQQKIDVVFAPIDAILQRLPPPSFLMANTLIFKVGERFAIQNWQQQIDQAGYTLVQTVQGAGEYAIRGAIIDIFPAHAKMPYRFELFDEEIEAIKVFDIESQRSIEAVDSIELLPLREYDFSAVARDIFKEKWQKLHAQKQIMAMPLVIQKSLERNRPFAGIYNYLPLFFERSASFFDYLPNHSVIHQIKNSPDLIATFWQGLMQTQEFLKHDADQPALPPSVLYLNQEEYFLQFKEKNNQNNQNNHKKFTRYDWVYIDKIDESLDHIQQNAGRETNIQAGFNLNPCDAIRLPKSPSITASHLDSSIQNLFKKYPDYQIIFLSNRLGRCDYLAQQLKQTIDLLQKNNRNDLKNIEIQQQQKINYFDDLINKDSVIQLKIAVALLQTGLIFHSQKIIFLTENDLLENNANDRRSILFSQELKDNQNPNKKSEGFSPKHSPEQYINDVRELEPGDPIVHLNHGVGRYQSLVNPFSNMEGSNQNQEFMHIRFADETDLYVPIHQLHLVSKYQGDPDFAPWHTLSGKAWQKAKQKAWQKIHDTAAELITLYAARELKKTKGFEFDSQEYQKFVSAFPYQETIDQITAIDAVLNDLRAERPMDRLICGDVGFGKTEVALRAAFATILAGKQVVLLAPTTLLAEQHFQNFSSRFIDWPIKIAELSRFKSAKEVKQSIEDLENGKLDMVISTHKILTTRINFERLGLVIVDEEHRFGVRQKEQLKHLRKDVHILSMTATPIPRTLGMALEGVRDFSIISTPPQKRLSVKTLIRQESKSILREAVLREIKRGGQIYFLHNSIETIEHKKQQLQEILPEIQIEILHGQMPAKTVENIMNGFTQQRFQMLLCTTIIETGIDIANANTIIINKAHSFGLAQLHQLRGRVGRSHHQAYAYLLVDDWQALDKKAQKRLEAISQLQDLGSGFALAMQDMEIRGSGEILGEKQSGEMHEMGFSLYADMLNHTVKQLKKGKAFDLESYHQQTEIDLNISTIISDDYIADVHERLNFYKLLSQADAIYPKSKYLQANKLNIDLNDTTAITDLSQDNDGSKNISLVEIKELMIDRFGQPPPPTQNLFKLHQLRIQVHHFGISKIQFTPQNIHLHLSGEASQQINHGLFIQYLQSHKNISFIGGNHLKMEVQKLNIEERWQLVQDFLKAVFNNYN